MSKYLKSWELHRVVQSLGEEIYKYLRARKVAASSRTPITKEEFFLDTSSSGAYFIVEKSSTKT